MHIFIKYSFLLISSWFSFTVLFFVFALAFRSSMLLVMYLSLSLFSSGYIIFYCIIHGIIQVVVYLDHCMCLPADSAASQISCYMSPSSPISACEGEGEGAPSSGFLIFWYSVASSAATSPSRVISVSALASISRLVPSLFALLCPME